MADAPGAAAAADQAKRDLDLQQHLTTGEKNPRNIPTVVFIVRVECACMYAIPSIHHQCRGLKPLGFISILPACHTYLQDDVEAFLQQKLGSVAAETAIGAFNELYSYVRLAGAIQFPSVHPPPHWHDTLHPFIPKRAHTTASTSSWRARASGRS